MINKGMVGIIIVKCNNVEEKCIYEDIIWHKAPSKQNADEIIERKEACPKCKQIDKGWKLLDILKDK